MNVIFNKPWETMGGFCQDPVTMAVISTGIKVMSTIQQSKAAQNAAKFDQQVAEQNRQIAKGQTADQMEQQDRERRLRQGANIAGSGASGTGMDSFGDVLQSNAAQEEMDLLTIQSEGLLRQRNFQIEGEQARVRGANAKSQMYTSVAGDILGGYSKSVANKPSVPKQDPAEKISWGKRY